MATARGKQRNVLNLIAWQMASLLATLPAHADSIGNIPSAYVPEGNYRRFNCQSLLLERTQVDGELAKLATELQEYRSRYFVDILALGLPAATFRGDTVAAETVLEHRVSHAKGELEAISSAYNHKNCSK
jgi:hypothetical protein